VIEASHAGAAPDVVPARVLLWGLRAVLDWPGYAEATGWKPGDEDDPTLGSQRLVARWLRTMRSGPTAGEARDARLRRQWMERERRRLETGGAHADLRLPAMREASDRWQSRLERIGRLLRLSPVERDVLALLATPALDRVVEETTLGLLAWPVRRGSGDVLDAFARVAATALGVAPDAVLAALAPEGVLHRSGAVRVRVRGDGVVDELEAAYWATTLVSSDRAADDLERLLSAEAAPSPDLLRLTGADEVVQGADGAAIAACLRVAAARREPLSVLVIGEAGTEPLAVARALCAEVRAAEVRVDVRPWPPARRVPSRGLRSAEVPDTADGDAPDQAPPSGVTAEPIRVAASATPRAASPLGGAVPAARAGAGTRIAPADGPPLQMERKDKLRVVEAVLARAPVDVAEGAMGWPEVVIVDARSGTDPRAEAEARRRLEGLERVAASRFRPPWASLGELPDPLEDDDPQPVLAPATYAPTITVVDLRRGGGRAGDFVREVRALLSDEGEELEDEAERWERSARFDLVLRVPPQRPAVVRARVEEALRGLPVSPALVEELSARRVSRTALAEGVALVRRLGLTEGEYMQHVERALRQAARIGGRWRRAAGGRPRAMAYDLAWLCTSVPAEPLIESLVRERSGIVLFYGPPGTGKTELARELARRMGATLREVPASSLLSRYVGDTERAMARTFEEARREGAVLLIDEADSFLQPRARALASWEVTQTNEMLVRMEAFDGVLVCATNLAEGLDPAVMRRFDVKVRFDPPTAVQREALVRAAAEALGLPDGDALDDLARARVRRLEGLTAGDVASVVRGARLLRDVADVPALLARLEECLEARPGATRSAGFR
jgi:hypothetical protein